MKYIWSYLKTYFLYHSSSLSLSNQYLGEHVVAVCKVMSSNLKKDFQFPHELKNDEKNISVDAVKCMYFGNIINLMHTCMYEEKRDRRSFNIPLLLNLLVSCGWTDGVSLPKGFSMSQPATDFLSAVQFVLIRRPPNRTAWEQSIRN